MTTWLVSRHPGAVEWLRRRYPAPDIDVVAHLDISAIRAGDRVMGTLPVQAIAEIWARGGTYLHLAIPMHPADRGRELSAADLDRLGARLECYYAERRPPPDHNTPDE